MSERPDGAVLLMIVLAVGFAAGAGFVARQCGLPADQYLLAANFTFSLTCYATTYAFRSVLLQAELHKILKRDGKKVVDISDLCGDTCKPAAEKIWAHKNVTRWVLIKTYSTETRSAFDRIANNLVYALIGAVVISGLVVLVWSPGPAGMPVQPATATSGFALLATFLFTVARVYIPILEIAQRNLKLLTDS